MRRRFIQALVRHAEQNPAIVLLTADLGYTVVEPFVEKFPTRFFNVGVAEQNMVGLATGLAEAGFMPFVYSIGTFATIRPFEFLRNGPALHRLPVRVIGVGGGFEYGTAGYTHHVLEDVGLMSMLPGMKVVTPGDADQLEQALDATVDSAGPVYYRLGKDEQFQLPGLGGTFAEGKLQVLQQGTDVALVALGTIAREALTAASLLEAEGVRPTVAIVSSVRPFPTDDLTKLFRSHRFVFTIEAHVETGGIGLQVGAYAAERGNACVVHRLAVTAPPDGRSGSEQFLLRKNGLDGTSIFQRVLRAVRPSVSLSR